MALLPLIDSPVDYRRVRNDEGIWRPAIQVIAERHGLAVAGLQRASGGTHVVHLDEAVVVKLYVPLWGGDAASEADMLAHVDGRLSAATPAVVATGELEGWRYLVMSRVPGRPLSERWSALDPGPRLRLLARLGELAAELHALPLPTPLADARAEWVARVDERLARLPAKQREDGLDEAWVEAVVAEAAELDHAALRSAPLGSLHMDLHHDHLTVREVDGELELAGLFDFGDATVGAREHDLVAPLAFMAHDVAGGAEALLRGYGYPAEKLDHALARRLTGQLLLQRYCRLPGVIDRLGEPAPRDVDELLARLWTFV